MSDQRRQTRPASREWTLRGWLIAGGLAGCSIVVTFIATGVVAFMTQNPCFEPASDQQLRTAQVLLMGQLVVTLAPWLVVAWWRQSPLLVAFGVLASSYAVWAAAVVLHSSTGDWTSFGVCF